MDDKRSTWAGLRLAMARLFGGSPIDPPGAFQRDMARIRHRLAPPMDVVCSWCGKAMGVKPGPPGLPGKTHGICPECLEIQLEEARRLQGG